MKQLADQKELESIHRSGRGFIYNDDAGRGADGKNYNVLHSAGCQWVADMLVTAPKYFFDSVDEAAAWLGQNRGAEGVNWKRCGTCRPGSDQTLTSQADTAVPRPLSSAPQPAAGPFTESQVEKLLIDWLQGAGYMVQTQVPAPSGIIDIVVGGKESEWIIEVKGEDKGGYTTAQMNFQQGLGQLLSRMTDASKKYALAIPVADDYRKVLEKYRGTYGAELLGVYFLTVGRDGGVKRFEGFEIDDMIESMGRTFREAAFGSDHHS